MEFEPRVSPLYPILVDGPNFEKLCDGQPFEPLRYVEGPSNRPQAHDGSIPVPSTWKTRITIPGATAPVKCYVLLKNDDPRDSGPVPHRHGVMHGRCHR